MCKKYAQKMDQFEDISAGGDFEVVTALSSRVIPLNVLGILLNKDECQEQEARTSAWSIEKTGTELVRYHNTPTSSTLRT